VAFVRNFVVIGLGVALAFYFSAEISDLLATAKDLFEAIKHQLYQLIE